MARESRLGKGLDALIPPSESAIQAGDIQQIELARIAPNPHQPRSRFEGEPLAELAESIRAHGVIQPLIVTQSAGSPDFVLIAGERRLQAAKLAGLDQVPVVVREADDQQLVELALVENLQRADLNPLEAAEAYQQLHGDFGLSHEQIAERVGKSRVAITNTVGLLELSRPVKKALLDGEISEGHARALKGLAKAQAQRAALKTVVAKELNVRQTEELVRKLKGGKTSKAEASKPSPQIQALQDDLRQALGTRVTLQHGPKGGRITLFYYSDEELNSLVDRLLED